MPSTLLVDADVLIDYLRGYPPAVEWLEGAKEPLAVSAITVAELFAGVRDGPERLTLETFLDAFEVVHADRRIAERGGAMRRDQLKSHGTGLVDALIAATAAVREARLVTLNETHFVMLSEVLVPHRKG